MTVAVNAGSGDDIELLKFVAVAELVFAIIAAFCSSPQTVEINATQRSKTLMKWVGLGLGTSAIFVVICTKMDKKSWPSLMGGVLAGGTLGIAYVYAKHSGLKNPGLGTENA